MTSKGRFTLPAAVRRALALHQPGEKLLLSFRLSSHQVIQSRPISLQDIQARANGYIQPGTTPLTDVDEFYNAREAQV